MLISQRNGDMYIGSTENVDHRLKLHNAGRVRSTKPNRPWKLVEVRMLPSRSEAVKMERLLRSHQQKECLKSLHRVH
ncbi:MAG: GIY-YIG nuclease family protein [Candidatus Yanofskybacteria bacterium]|nr:GIY-YIG nuclease family protein [Candidatus Yanofskybacteria bacterium]